MTSKIVPREPTPRIIARMVADAHGRGCGMWVSPEQAKEWYLLVMRSVHDDDAAPAMEKPAEDPPKIGIDEAVRKFCNMTPEQMRAWIIKHDDPPSCPHGVMAGACPFCMGMAGKYRQEPPTDRAATEDASAADADDLVERLREAKAWLRLSDTRHWGAEINDYSDAPFDAADRIAELRAEIARLRKTALSEAYDALVAHNAKIHARIVALRMAGTKLRSAIDLLHSAVRGDDAVLNGGFDAAEIINAAKETWDNAIDDTIAARKEGER